MADIAVAEPRAPVSWRCPPPGCPATTSTNCPRERGPTMRRARVLRHFLALLLGALSFVSATAPSGAARLVDEPSAVAVAPLGVAAAEGPSPRIAFGNVVSQAATSVNKVVTAIDSTPVANLKSVSLSPGQTVTFNISGQVQNAAAVDVADL